MRPPFAPAASAKIMHDLSLVFVYGTLKRGLFNSKHLSNSLHVGSARTAAKLPLVTDEFYVPYLLHKEGMGHRVEGELYAVDDAVLAKLDELEGVPHYYERCRKEVEVTALAADAAAPAGAAARVAPWVYMLPGERVTDAHLEREMLPSYEPAKHFTHYVPRAHRPRSHAAFSGGAAPREAQRPLVAPALGPEELGLLDLLRGAPLLKADVEQRM